ncbi:MAG: hypothetical protein VX089_03815 [Pseudomonadota bacterium]|nr:hypothetical protein [Pseudomonadota bacterium]
MNSLLLIERKFSEATIYEICHKNNCDIVFITKNLLEILRKKKKPINQIILITKKILPRKSNIYKSVKSFIKNKDIFFVEISIEKTRISQELSCSNAILNGIGRNAENTLYTLISRK